MKQKSEFKFHAEDFWNLLNSQHYKCALTDRELTPQNTEVELRDPNKGEFRAELSNHYLVDRQIRYLARHLSESQIIELAIEIVRHRGKEFGYSLKKWKCKI